MKKAKRPRELTPAQLRWRADPRALGFRSTAELRCCRDIIGQPRALAAMRLGIECQSPGYNIYVCGLTGTGKATAIQQLLQELRAGGSPPPDLCYVHQFRQPDAPACLELAAGRGRALRRDVQDLSELLRRALAGQFQSSAFKEGLARLEQHTRDRIRALFDALDERAQRDGFRIVPTEAGPTVRAEVLPLWGSKPVAWHELEATAKRKPALARRLPALRLRRDALGRELDERVQRSRGLERDLRQAAQALVRSFGGPTVHDAFEDVRAKYDDVPRVIEWLGHFEENLHESLDTFAAAPEALLDTSVPSVLDAAAVNVLVDNTGVTTPPVVVESAPSLRNLFGGVDRTLERSGAWRADHLNIRAGSLLRANGGYLVFNLADTGGDAVVWLTLKRVLKSMRAEIPSFDPVTGQLFGGLQPEAVQLRLKVIMIGDTHAYQTLFDQDDDFQVIFKVKADFDSVMARNRRSQREYATLVATLCKTENLLPFDAGAVAALLEVGVRLAGRQNKLSTRFTEIADVIREAHYWAQKDKRRIVSLAHVDRAVHERTARVSLIEAKVQEAFESGQILLETRGTRTGQVNALTVFDYGDHVFGRPTRITSQVSMGRSGIVNIEREASLSGATHDKGVLILAGYLRAMYAQDKPLTLSASLAFEQSYTGVDGDSATAAEVYALLSAIANVPARQDLAITGSVDQRGQVQPVGSINEKIEGFFDVCRGRGLTGTQGVVIPWQTVADLMLRKDIVEAVRKRKFHLFPIRTLDEGIEIVFGVKAGRRRRFRFERDTFHRRVDSALFELAEGIKEFVDGNDTPSSRGGGPGLTDEDSDASDLRRRAARPGAPRARRPRATGPVRRHTPGPVRLQRRTLERP